MNPPSARQMHKPGVAASKTERALTRSGAVGCSPYGPGPNQPGVPGAGKPFGGGTGPGELGNGCSGAGRRARLGGPQGAPVGAAGNGVEGSGPDVSMAREGSRRGGRCGCGGGQARGGTPVHRSPGGVRGHRAGGHVEGLLRVALFSRRRDQRGQRRHGHRRLIERGTVLGGQRRHLGHRRGDRQRRGGGFGELGRTLDRSVLRTVLPGCHAVIVDAFARAAARSSRPRTGQ